MKWSLVLKRRSQEKTPFIYILHYTCIHIFINSIYDSNNCVEIKLIIIIIYINEHSSIDFKHFVTPTGRVAISGDCLSVYIIGTRVRRYIQGVSKLSLYILIIGYNPR